MNLPLHWGYCRNTKSRQSENGVRSRRRRRTQEAKAPLVLSQAVLLVSPKGDGAPSMTLCRLETPLLGSESNPSENIICFDDSVRVIVNSESWNGVDARTLPPALDPRRNDWLVPWRRIMERFDNKVPSGFACSDVSHSHVVLCEEDIGRGENVVLSQGLVAQVRSIPTTVLSMSLRRVPIGDKEEPVAPQNNQARILQQACQKRQLVGCMLLFDSDMNCPITTQFSVPTIDGSQLHYQVVSIVPQQQAVKESNFYIIMPSTRITFVEEKEEPDEKPMMSQLPQSRAVLSPAARLLVETIRCSRNDKKNVTVPRSFLFTGPPGVGKTHAVRMCLTEAERDVPHSTRLVSIQGSELLSAGHHPAEASKALEQQFMTAVNFCESDEKRVSVVFLDECEALLSADAASAMLGNLLDRVSFESGWRRIIVVAATNRIDAVPAWLRRPGRFDREVAMAPPNAQERFAILESVLCQQAQTSLDEQRSKPDLSTICSQHELVAIAEACVGYVAADLVALVRRAGLLAIQEQCRHVTPDLLRRAMEDVGASALRDAALAAPPTTRWEDIAGDAGGAKSALQRAVEWPRTKRDAYVRLGLVPPRGILLHGPPGCAKTTLARAAAGASGVAFLSLSPADVYASSYVGEAEAVVRRAFTLARSAAPCILFFDEIDSVLGAGGSNNGGMQGRGSSAEARVLSTFLNEMDGVDGSREDGVLVLGATNRPSTLDAALLRPGRFDNVIYVPPPDKAGRKSILKMQCEKWNCQTEAVGDVADARPFIDVDTLANDSVTGLMTGAEIVGACREAAMISLREALERVNQQGTTDNNRPAPLVSQACMEKVLKEVKPLLSDANMLEEYTKFETSRSQR